MNNVLKYFAVMQQAIKSNLAYVGSSILRSILLAAALFVVVQLWITAFSQSQMRATNGFSFAEMIWYLAITEAILMSSPRTAPIIDEDVRTGALAVQLIRPLSYPLAKLAELQGERIVSFSINLLVAFIIAFLITGILHVSAIGLLMLAISLPLAFLLDFLLAFSIGLCAFWLEDTTGIWRIYTSLRFLLGGAIIPVTFFPAQIQLVVKFLPFASMIYIPARLFVHPQINLFANLLATQALSATVLVTLVAFIYSRAIKQVNANGG